MVDRAREGVVHRHAGVAALSVINRRVLAPSTAALSTAGPSLPGLAALLAGPVPASLRSPAMLVVLIGWGLVPLVVGYRRFSRSDLG